MGIPPRLIKELKRCGWGIDSDGYIYPLEKLQSKFNLLVDRRLKRSLAVASLVGTFSSIVALIAEGQILVVLLSSFILAFVTFYCVTYLVDNC